MPLLADDKRPCHLLGIGDERCVPPFGQYKIFFYLFLCVQESLIPLLTPPISIAHTTAVLLRDFLRNI